MSCEQYRKHDLGELSDTQFQAHIQTCSECQQHLVEDEQLLVLARELKRPIRAPHLWDRIVHTLSNEQISKKATPLWASPTARWLAAAVLVLGLGLGYVLSHRTPSAPSGLLTADTLAQVERTERDYIAAIVQLEQRAQTKLMQIEPDRSYLYRDKLTIIEEQITLCQEAIAENPANAHIRRYLLAALQDKHDALNQLMVYEPPVQ